MIVVAVVGVFVDVVVALVLLSCVVIFFLVLASIAAASVFVVVLLKPSFLNSRAAMDSTDIDNDNPETLPVHRWGIGFLDKEKTKPSRRCVGEIPSLQKGLGAQRRWEPH